ncbi:MAG: hypothetical protein ACLF0G_02985 [Candidatus Brocadiia bacterium]
MSRRRTVFLASALVVAAGLAVAAWLLWAAHRPPPPSTAEEVTAAVTEADPSELSDEELEQWVRRVADLVERLPPHECERLVQRATADPALRERFRKLDPERREKLFDLISAEQRARMMSQAAQQWVQRLKKLPAPARKALLRTMGAAARKRRGKRRTLSKDQIARHLAATTPTERARFVRTMREAREMMKEAGVGR